MNSGLLLHEWLVVALGLGILLAELWIPDRARRYLGHGVALCLGAILVWSLFAVQVEPGVPQFAFGKMYALDGLALFFKRFFLVAALLVVVLTIEFSSQIETGLSEFYALLMFALAGMLFASSANDFALLFVSLELITVTFYILTSFQRGRRASLEAGVKYLIIGALSTAFTVFGIALVSGLSGTLNFRELAAAAPELGRQPLFQCGLMLVRPRGGGPVPFDIKLIDTVGSAAWTADGSGILYTRYPHAGERPEVDVNFYQQVWFHRLGTPVSEDRYEIGKDFPRIAEIELDSSDDGQWFIAKVANGDGGDFVHFVRDAAGKWSQLTRFEDGVKGVRIGRDNALYMISLAKAPRGKILRLPLNEADLAKAQVLLPEQKGVVTEMAPCDHGIYVSFLQGGPSELRYFPQNSQEGREIPVLPVSDLAGLQSWHGDQLIFGNVSYLSPFAWYSFNPDDKSPARTALYTTSPVDFSGVEVVREFAVSKDGTKVPLNILRKKGTPLNSQNPTILYGYGGYSVSMTPRFDATLKPWLDVGGVFVVANLRGGGEYGEVWHKQGNLLKKQNVFDDFIAAAKYLIQRKYTSSAKLAVEGGSNGGLLMGAFLTQQPELARAVVSYVGIYDMLRVELDPNGQFNVTEFGTVKDPDQFKALFAYSPFHRVKDGVKYPAVLFTTGENDGRVNPAQSRKMAARLQAATGSDRPVLFMSNSSGHGIGTALTERISQEADVYSFLFKELGVDKSRLD